MATTGIYTYRHTLTLRYALPISSRRERVRGAVPARRSGTCACAHEDAACGGHARGGFVPGAAGVRPGRAAGPGAAAGAGGICRACRLRAAARRVDTDGLMPGHAAAGRSEEHTSELQSLMRISYAVFCLKKKT